MARTQIRERMRAFFEPSGGDLVVLVWGRAHPLAGAAYVGGFTILGVLGVGYLGWGLNGYEALKVAAPEGLVFAAGAYIFFRRTR